MVVIIWLAAYIPSGIDGPVTMMRILRFASKWQAVVAATVAVFAAWLAYRSSMAKVEFDRFIADRADRRARLAIYLKLGFAMRVLRHECEQLIKRIERHDARSRTFAAKSINPILPEAVVEAWDNLDKFPTSIARKLSSIRISFYNFDLYRSQDDREWKIPPIGPQHEDVWLLKESCDLAIGASKDISNRLDTEVRDLMERD